MEIQTGVLAVLALVAFVAFALAILGSIPKWNIWMKSWQRIALVIIGLLALYILLIGLELLPNPLQKEPEATPETTTSTETPFSEDLPIPRRAVQVLDEYYQLINNAANKLDLGEAWHYLSPGFQCSSSNCDEDEYKKFWWSVTVEYELYDCEVNESDVHLTYYNRNDGTPTGETKFLRYTLEEGMNENWFIVNGEVIEGSNCEPYTTGE